MRIRGQMYFWVEPPFSPTHILLSSLCSSCMRMHFNMTRINQYPFEVRGIDSLFEQSFPYVFISPSTKPPMSILPVSIVRREVSPWSSCAKDPEDSVNEQAVVCGCSLTLSSGSFAQELHGETSLLTMDTGRILIGDSVDGEIKAYGKLCSKR